MKAAKSNQVAVPLRGSNTFVAHAANVWNASEKLHAAFRGVKDCRQDGGQGPVKAVTVVRRNP
jgi:hypothetical protein